MIGKRVVLEHSVGRLKGIFRILGVTDQPDFNTLPTPFQVTTEEPLIESVALVKAHERWIHFKETKQGTNPEVALPGSPG